MLILTRRVGETLVIGQGDQQITVIILGINGGQVRIGTKAPPETVILREELIEREQDRQSA